MSDFFPIETPYSSKDYEIMKNVVNKGIDSHLSGFVKSKFTKSPHHSNKFLWNIHTSELPILYRRLEDLYNQTGDDDYDSFLNDVQHVANTADTAIAQGEFGEDDMDLDENSIREMIRQEMESIQGENSSNSLMIKHGENSKPLDETWGKRYEQIAFLQGEEASEVMDILNNDGEEAALTHLQMGHYPGEHDAEDEIGTGKYDDKLEKDGYIMTWNSRLPYISLVYDTQHKKLDEDSLTKRHQAGQREKDVPLGKHAPHSQKAKK